MMACHLQNRQKEVPTVTIDAFIHQYALALRATRTDRNPNMTGSQPMDHWRCVLSCGRRRMTIVFSQGSGFHGAEPALRSVLDCLASDASSLDTRGTFEEWAADLGWDPDSRTAERSYRACQRQTRQLRTLLGTEAYEALLTCERL
jgi:hypothetical protein